MAISNYTELKDSITSWMTNRTDLAPHVPDFISLCEAKLRRRYKDFQPLSDSNTTNWILEGYPDVYLYGSLLEIAPFLDEDERINTWGTLFTTAIQTLRGSYQDSNFNDYDGLVMAISDWLGRADIDIVIPQLIRLCEAKLNRRFRELPPLGAVNTSNFVLSQYPDVYLYGSLVEAAPYLGEDPRIAVWGSMYDAAMARTRIPQVGAAYDNLGNLVIAVADTLGRTDIDDAIVRFIGLAEAQISRELRHYNMQKRVSAVATDRFLPRPGDWIETIRMHVASSNTEPLQLISRDDMMDKRAKYNDQTGTPRFYCHVESGFELFPTPSADTDIELLYYASIDRLVGNDATNWLLDRHPDVYLYGALTHALEYVDDSLAKQWQVMFVDAVKRVQLESDKSMMSGVSLRKKVRGMGGWNS